MQTSPLHRRRLVPIPGSWRTRLGALLLPLGLAAPATAQWLRRTPATNPGAGSFPLAYDSARGQTVLFGGATNNQTWEWDGTNWVRRAPLTSPTARTGCALAYDSARGRTVLFGGQDTVSFAYLADTWEWDGTDWLQRTPATSPSARNPQALAYDSRRARTVLFGGFYGNFFGLWDTWEWDGTNWSLLPVSGPAGRFGHGLAYDASRACTVLSGGFTGSYPGDTWEWDGVNWLQRATTGAALTGSGMAYDQVRQRVLRYGGNFTGTVLAGQSEWDGTNWLAITQSTNPGARSGHGFAYDSRRHVLVLYGGSNTTTAFADTWEYGYQAAVTRSGTGCGLPVTQDAGRPVLGTSISLTVGGIPGGSLFGVELLGFDSGGIPLPDAPGCTLYVLPIAIMLPFATPTSSVVVGPVAIPNDPSLVGGTLALQALVVNPASNTLGIVSSNLATLLFGNR